MKGRCLLILSTLFLVSFGDTIVLEPALEVTVDRGEFGTRPPDCGRYYNNGNHERWAECMGVGYKRLDSADE